MGEGFNINSAFSKIYTNLNTQATKLETAMNNVGEDISQQDMLKLQFQVNQYNMLLEATSTISKALTDEIKQLAQRAN